MSDYWWYNNFSRPVVISNLTLCKHQGRRKCWQSPYSSNYVPVLRQRLNNAFECTYKTCSFGISFILVLNKTSHFLPERAEITASHRDHCSLTDMSSPHIQAHTHTYVQLKRAVPVSVSVPKRVSSKWHLVVRSDLSRREEKGRPAIQLLTFPVAQTHKCEIIGKTGTNRVKSGCPPLLVVFSKASIHSLLLLIYRVIH